MATHYRRTSESNRLKLISDSYFLQKLKSRRSKSLSREKVEGKVDVKLCVKLREIRVNAEGILNNLSLVHERSDDREKGLILALIVIVDDGFEWESKSLSEKAIRGHVNSKGFTGKLKIFSTTIKFAIKISDKGNYQRILKAAAIYSDIETTLYGFTFTKLLVKFIESVLDLFDIRFRPARIIDYFDSIISPSGSTASSRKKAFEKGPGSDYYCETTKEEEENLFTNGDEHEYEALFNEDYGKAVCTEPDFHETRVEGLIQKKRAMIPSRLRQGMTLQAQGANRIDMWTKYAVEFRFNRKLEEKFEAFWIKKAEERVKAEGVSKAVEWVWKHSKGLAEEFIKKEKEENQVVDELKFQAMITHLNSKKTLASIFRKVEEKLKRRC